MTMKQLLSATLFFLLSSPGIASVSGTVVDVDGQPLADCDVRSGDTVIQSGSDGSFAIDPAAEDKLRIDCRGYVPLFVEPGAGGGSLGELTAKRPNFIFLLSDDQGWVQTSTQMDPDDPTTRSDYFRTPNIDGFFASGMRFVRGYSPGT